MRTVLGFRAHSGWAAMVAVAGTVDALRVLERRRIAIADPLMPGSKQPYHAAAELPFPQAEALVRQAVESSRALALGAMAAAVEALRSQGHEVAGCAVVLGSGHLLPGLAGILASHALIHTAEGEMFRDVLVWAAQKLRLPVTGVRQKELDATALNRIGGFGKLIGPPWTPVYVNTGSEVRDRGCADGVVRYTRRPTHSQNSYYSLRPLITCSISR